MKRTTWLWLIAFAVAVVSARYQRMTGPTFPLHGRAALGPTEVAWTLERAHAGAGGHRVEVKPGDPRVRGELEWKRSGSDEAWKVVPMRRDADALVAYLPNQPPAGQLLYRLTLSRDGERIVIPERSPAVLRFRGNVPMWILVPHVVAMFAAMLVSTRAGLELFNPRPRFGPLVAWTLGILVLGAFVFGPLVQACAFGSPWTGFPVGKDLTENKMLVAALGWIAAAIAVRRLRRPGGVVLGAAIVTLLAYLIPHSLPG